MSRLGLLILIVLFGCSSDRDGFSEKESELIISQQGNIMRLFTIEQVNDSLLLRQKAGSLSRADINTDLFRLLKSGMLSTVNDTTNPGVGIAAPQVGVSKRLIAVQRFDKTGEPFEFYINPEIIYYSDDLSIGPEGCLSIPERMDSVKRSEVIVVSYTDEITMENKQDTVKGFTAIIFQHETDHLNGVLFTDRVKKQLKID